MTLTETIDAVTEFVGHQLSPDEVELVARLRERKLDITEIVKIVEAPAVVVTGDEERVTRYEAAGSNGVRPIP